jgi:hypothetical protein
MEMQKVVLLAVLVISLPVFGAARTSREINEANNPLTPKITVNLQDQYVSSYYGLKVRSRLCGVRDTGCSPPETGSPTPGHAR